MKYIRKQTIENTVPEQLFKRSGLSYRKLERITGVGASEIHRVFHGKVATEDVFNRIVGALRTYVSHGRE